MDNSQYSLSTLKLDDYEIPTGLCKLENDILEEYTCCVCLNLINNPTSCKSCELLICSKCMDNSLKKSDKCPNCKNIFTSTEVKGKLKSLMNKIELQCLNEQCRWPIKYEFLEDHLLECPYTKRIAQCEGCMEDIQTTNVCFEIRRHIEICPEAFLNCMYCKAKLKRKGYEEHKLNCSEFPIQCVYCDAVFPIKHLKGHEREECVKSLKEKFSEERDNMNHEIIQLRVGMYVSWVISLILFLLYYTRMEKCTVLG
jgi:hypothetical protein